jgi:hypothetical protein
MKSSLIACAAFLLAAPCFAAELPLRAKAPPAATDVSIHRYDERNPSCTEWTDGCRICSSDGCSNIGIACQPKTVTCTAQQPASEKPK